jgi:hypothetical protein
VGACGYLSGNHLRGIALFCGHSGRFPSDRPNAARVALLKAEYGRGWRLRSWPVQNYALAICPSLMDHRHTRNALIAERAALAAYTEAVADLNALVLNSKRPSK